MKGSLGVRPLRRGEIGPAARMLAVSFDEDPLFQWFAESARKRRAILEWFHQSSLRECFDAGGVFTLDEDDGARRGVVAIVPPGQWPPPLARTLRALVIPRALSARLVFRGAPLEREMRARHPAGDHVYVCVLGVHPSQKGSGLGGLLLRHALSIATTHRSVLHLETSNPKNLSFYRRFGLDVTSEITSHGGPTLWTMATPGSA